VRLREIAPMPRALLDCDTTAAAEEPGEACRMWRISWIRPSEITSQGEAILRFDKALVSRLVVHVRNAPKSRAPYDEGEAEPALWLVGDAGVYLMSNGSLPFGAVGRFSPLLPRIRTRDPEENWRPIDKLFDDGSDFALPIPLAHFEAALSRARSQIVLVENGDHYSIYSDAEYDGGKPRSVARSRAPVWNLAGLMGGCVWR
jgi:hypothetical protein